MSNRRQTSRTTTVHPFLPEGGNFTAQHQPPLVFHARKNVRSQDIRTMAIAKILNEIASTFKGSDEPKPRKRPAGAL